MQAVWFSASADLAVDAMRDFKDIGAYKYDPIRIHDLKRVGQRPGQKLEDLKVRALSQTFPATLGQKFSVLVCLVSDVVSDGAGKSINVHASPMCTTYVSETCLMGSDGSMRVQQSPGSSGDLA